MSRGPKVALIVAAVVVAGVAFLLLNPGDNDTAESPTQTDAAETMPEPPAEPDATETPEEPPVHEEPSAVDDVGPAVIEVKDGEPVRGVAELTFNKGERVGITVRSDVEEEVHVHGYDMTKDVAPGKAATFNFPAKLEGIFEVELEVSHVQIATLEVRP